MNESLLGHIAIGFSSHPENVATESLNYILKKSSSARFALSEFLQIIDGDLARELSFRSQKVGDDGSIPDLVGIDIDGIERVVIESKFWAGLTDHQPVSYLNRLPANESGLLLFVVPELRSGLIWPELISRCRDAGIDLQMEAPTSNHVMVCTINQKHKLAIASWRVLLNHIASHLKSSNELQIAADVAQLQGLCERMDENAFLPLRSEELSPSIGLRYTQFCSLVDEVSDRLAKEGLINRDGLKTAGGGGTYVKYIYLVGFGCSLEVNSYLWAKERETPLWLVVKDQKWVLSKIVHEALSPLQAENPPRVIFNENAALIPLRMPVCVERTAVVDSVSTQIRDVALLLKSASVTV